MVKHIDISINKNAILIGKCDYVIISKSKEHHKIIFSNIVLNDEIKIKDTLKISILLKGYYLMKFELYVKEFINENENSLELKVEIFNNQLNPFNQSYLDIFYKWEKGIKTDWKLMKSTRNKETWIRCCNILNGVVDSIKIDKNYVIDGNLVKHPIDFHCLFGELFLGENGYFGSDYHSFKDCLTQTSLKSNSNKIDSEIEILNYNTLDLTISKFDNYIGYVDAIFNELELSGFKIVKN